VPECRVNAAFRFPRWNVASCGTPGSTESGRFGELDAPLVLGGEALSRLAAAAEMR